MSTDEHAGTLYYSVMFFQYLYIYIYRCFLLKKPDSKKGQRGLIHFAAWNVNRCNIPDCVMFSPDFFRPDL